MKHFISCHFNSKMNLKKKKKETVRKKVRKEVKTRCVYERED